MAKGGKRKGSMKRTQVKTAPHPSPSEACFESAGSTATKGWESPPLPLCCEEDNIPEHVLEEAYEAQEPAASQDWETLPLPYEKDEISEPVLKEADKAEEPTPIDKSIFRDTLFSEYHQPESSPYEGGAAIIHIGRSEKQYVVPLKLIERVPSLQQQHNGLQTLVMLPEVDDDIGHTLIHYLYTGAYQTLRQNSICDTPSRTTEYRRSVLAYYAALCYGFDGLADLGRKYMQTFDKNVPLFDIIALGRKYFPKVTQDAWYASYITRKIMVSFENDEDIFQQEEFFEGFGLAAPEFDKFLGKIMAKAYAQKISLIREASDLKRVDKKQTNSTALNEKNTALSIYNACTAPQRCNEQYSHVNSEKLTSSTDHGALLHGKEYEYTDVESSQASLLTPSRGSDEMAHEGHVGIDTAKESVSYLGSDDSVQDCAHWQQHSAHGSLWKSCPSCKTHILNMLLG